MTSYIAKSLMTLGFAAAVVASPAWADGENIGDTQMCIESNRISSTQILNRKTILVKMSPGNGYKRIDLLNNCSTLDKTTGFAYDTSINKLCKQDALRVLDSGQTCLIDKIVTIDAAEAKALQQRKKK